MKLMVTLLTSSSSWRLKRLIRSLEGQRQVPGLEVVPIIVVNTKRDDYYQKVLSLDLPYPVVRTDSNGKPGKGKNSCAEIFLSSDCDYLSQIDGDDILYPTYLKSLYEHIQRHPNIDVLGVIPADQITRDEPVAGHQMSLGSNTYAGVWGVSVTPMNVKFGPGPSHIWEEEMPFSVDFIILQSRRSAIHKINEEIPIQEDHLYSYQLLAEYQKGNIEYYLTMSSDLYLIDRTTEDSVQKSFDHTENMVVFKEKVLDYVSKERSSLYELPVVYKPLLIDQFEKERWIRTQQII